MAIQKVVMAVTVYVVKLSHLTGYVQVEKMELALTSVSNDQLDMKEMIRKHSVALS